MGDQASEFSTGMNQAINALMMMVMMKMMIPGGGPSPFMAGIGMGMGKTSGKGVANVRPKGFRANIGAGLGRAAGAVGGLGGGVIGKLGTGIAVAGKGLLRFLPVIGQVIFGFQALNGILKMIFKFSLAEKLGGMLKGVGQALNLVDTPAEKAAKALDKVGAAAATALAKGAFGGDFGEGGFTDYLAGMAAQDYKDKGLTDEQEKAVKQAEGKEKAIAFRSGEIQQQMKRASFEFNKKLIARAAGVSMELLDEWVKEKGGGSLDWTDRGGNLLQVPRMDETQKTPWWRAIGLDPSGKTNWKKGVHVREGLSQEQQRTLSEFDLELLKLAPEESKEKFLKMAETPGVDLSQIMQKMLGEVMEGLSEEDRKTITKAKGVIEGEGDISEHPELAKKVAELMSGILEKEEKITDETTKRGRIQEKLAKARINNMLELLSLQVKMETSQERALKLEEASLGVTATRKAKIQSELSEMEAARTRKASHMKVATSVIQKEGVIEELLKSTSPTGEIDAGDSK